MVKFYFYDSIREDYNMSDNFKFYSEMEKYEIININDGDKYGYLANNDVVIDETGKLKLLIINDNKSKFSILSKSEFIEIPWECVKKIGSRTIIIDVDENSMKNSH